VFVQHSDAPEEQAAALEAVRQLALTLVQPSALLRAARQQQALRPAEVGGVAQPQASLRRPWQVAVEARLEPVPAQREQGEARQLQEATAAEEEQRQPERQVSFALLWPRLPWLPCPLLLFVPLQLPRSPAHENVRAPLPLRLLQ
jgi:hypothetical protein